MRYSDILGNSALMTISQKLLDHALPELLIRARALALADVQDTSILGMDPVLFPLQGVEMITISGRDRCRFLHAMLSADITTLAAGQGAWATFNDVKGRTISDLRLLVVDPDPKQGSMLALVEEGAGKALLDALSRFVIAEKVYFDQDGGDALWLLAGEGAEEALVETGAELPEPGLLNHRATQIGAAEVRLVRLDRSNTEGRDLLIIVAGEAEEAMLGTLSAVTRGETALLEAARIEAGQPRFGIDFTRANIPLEAGLEGRALNFEKGCYPGQEVICRINSMGAPARRLMRLSVAGGQAPEPGTLLFRDGKEVGYITSAVNSKRLGLVAALGYVGKRHCNAGTALQVGQGTDELTAQTIAPV